MVFTPETLRSKIRQRSRLVTNLLSEFYGTFLLLFIGIGIVCQFDLSRKQLNTWIQINIGWGFAIAFTVYTAAKTSGGHFNPAISLVMVTFGRLSVLHFILYTITQIVAAFFGALAAYFVYRDQFLAFNNNIWALTGPKATAGCFVTFPANHVSNWTIFLDQFVGTGLLALFVAVIIDKRNKIADHLHPLLFGFVVILIGTAFGMNMGYPINPARDLGPRILTLFFYGTQVLSFHNYMFWIPFVAPFPGALFGAWSYHLFVGAHIPDDDDLIDEKKAAKDQELQPLNA